MKLSVIIPVYNVRRFIGRCVLSLLSQELSETEYIFVDDGSTDGSIEVVEKMVEANHVQEKVKIIRHDRNRGLPSARNTGLAAATGEYVFHCDSDDYLALSALKAMYEAAKAADADIVYTDWTLTLADKKRTMHEPDCNTPEEALRLMLHGAMKWNVWNKLVRRCLYTIYGITFPEGHGMGEDMTMLLLTAYAKSIIHLPQPCYHYVRLNRQAFTAHRTEASYADLLFNTRRVVDGLKGKVSDEDLSCFLLNVKFPFLISPRREDYERWSRWFPEANAYIHRHQVSMRARFLERCAASRFYLPLKIHYILLQRLVGSC
ncbi:MAG: glycosyltransferase family 2 protein [Prevotella sp.]|nr:glycosyltransferase family 2 protein [Prevotella sp.]